VLVNGSGIHFTGDGWLGLPGQAPFDGIRVGAALPELPLLHGRDVGPE
jgi:protein-L-isoaspartate O-methyltransferase